MSQYLRVFALCSLAVAVAAQLRAAPAPAPSLAPDPAQIMVVGTFHFVSRANVHTMPADNPMSPRRQAEIADLVRHLATFQPSKVVLEQTSGTSDLESHYLAYIGGNFTLPPSENYQIGFRLARTLGHTRT